MMLKESAPAPQNRNWQPWVEPGAPPNVTLWRIDLDVPASGSVLSADEMARATRFKAEVHRARFVAGRVAVREILAQELGCEPRDLEFSYNRWGKPAVTSAPMSFNLAHSENVGLLAIATDLIGVDIERRRPVEFDLLARNVFSEGEFRMWQNSTEDQKPTLFYALWTRKEALLKAIGCGITEHVQNVSVFFENDAPTIIKRLDCAAASLPWRIHSFDIDQQFSAAIALVER
jgi:4'-phosphopantetheinyl transferase